MLLTTVWTEVATEITDIIEAPETEPDPDEDLPGQRQEPNSEKRIRNLRDCRQ